MNDIQVGHYQLAAGQSKMGRNVSGQAEEFHIGQYAGRAQQLSPYLGELAAGPLFVFAAEHRAGVLPACRKVDDVLAFQVMAHDGGGELGAQTHRVALRVGETVKAGGQLSARLA